MIGQIPKIKDQRSNSKSQEKDSKTNNKDAIKFHFFLKQEYQNPPIDIPNIDCESIGLKKRSLYPRILIFILLKIIYYDFKNIGFKPPDPMPLIIV